MPGNIEIKAKVKNLDDLMEKARAIAEEHIPLQQCDTFFNAPTGCRLKLRCEEKLATRELSACLIGYDRPDVTGPKFSHYVLTPVTDSSTMKEVLSMTNGIVGEVVKKRDVFIAKRNGLSARIHVDSVNGLGDFLEFEVIVENDSQLVEAQGFANYLSGYFGVSDEDQIPGAYLNLLQNKK